MFLRNLGRKGICVFRFKSFLFLEDFKIYWVVVFGGFEGGGGGVLMSLGCLGRGMFRLFLFVFLVTDIFS